MQIFTDLTEQERAAQQPYSSAFYYVKKGVPMRQVGM
jgi:hypothetical protein